MTNILIEILTEISSLVTADSGSLNDAGSIITSILTLLIGYSFTRRAYIRWRKELYVWVILLWVSTIILYLAYYPEITIYVIIIWMSIVARLLIIFYHINCLELIGFSKNDVESSINMENIENVKPFFNLDCLDKMIKLSSEKHFYPIILAADESWRPWRVAENFVSSYLNENSGVIYFTFARPHEKIKNALEANVNKIKGNTGKQSQKCDLENVVIIDCYEKLASNSKKWSDYKKMPHSENQELIIIADPRNPHDLNKKYEKALKRLIDGKGCSKICVVYDSLSDFLCFTDREIAIQYLRHNMYWEEKHNISSFYILRLGTVDKLYEEYLLWFANVVIYLETKDGKPVMRTSGLLSGPTCTGINYNFDPINRNLSDYAY